MGIPTYFQHIVKSHRSIIREILQHRGRAAVNHTDEGMIDNLYLDCNSIIYDTLRSPEMESSRLNDAEFTAELCRKTAVRVAEYIGALSPSDTVFIAFDGVAPCAKMAQQRLRRYRTQFDTNMTRRMRVVAESTRDVNRSHDTVESMEKNHSFSSISITPGTDFMALLGKTLRDYFRNATQFKVKNIIVSTSEEPGEGEHKIFEFVRANEERHRLQTTVIYGLDADLIMLTLNHLHISDRLFLFRETPEFIKTVDATLEPNKMYVLDIPVLGRAIGSLLKGTDGSIETNDTNDGANISPPLPPTPQSQPTNNSPISDYILMCFMLGNDFLPHFPALNIRSTGHDRLINAYRTVFAGFGDSMPRLTDGGRTIVWKNMRRYIAVLAASERDAIIEEEVRRETMGERMKRGVRSYGEDDGTGGLSTAYLNLPMTERGAERYIAASTDGWETRYYKELFRVEPTERRTAQISKNYLEGLEWTFLYYSSGCVDWRWKYNYNYPPLLTDLLGTIPYFDTTFVTVRPKNPVVPLVQLSYVLPSGQLKLIPAELRKKLRATIPGFYPEECAMEWAYCRYMWEAHAHLPTIPIETIESIVSAKM